MELRSFNVEKIWNTTVKCVIKEDIGIERDLFFEQAENIKSMLSQIETVNELVLAKMAHTRKDGEIWTPYLQIVIMLLRMGKRLEVVTYEGELNKNTIIRICQ